MSSKINSEIALTHLKNKQFLSAHNLFLNQAESTKKADPVKSALLYVLAAECKTRHGKDSDTEINEAGNLFLEYSKKDSKNIKGALLCASKCFLSFWFVFNM